MKFQIKIFDRLFLKTEDEAVSEKLVSDLRKLERTFPKIQAESEKLKEKLWEESERLRKATFLNNFPEKKEAQAGLWRAEAALKVPLRAYQVERERLVEGNERLTKELKAEILECLDKFLEEAQKLRTTRTVDTQKRFVDKGVRGEGDVQFRVLEDNHAAVQAVIDSLVGFKFEIRNKTAGFSYGEILEMVSKFEAQVNSLDVLAMEKKEVSESQWKEMRQSGLI